MEYSIWHFCKPALRLSKLSSLRVKEDNFSLLTQITHIFSNYCEGMQAYVFTRLLCNWY